MADENSEIPLHQEPKIPDVTTFTQENESESRNISPTKANDPPKNLSQINEYDHKTKKTKNYANDKSSKIQTLSVNMNNLESQPVSEISQNQQQNQQPRDATVVNQEKTSKSKNISPKKTINKQKKPSQRKENDRASKTAKKDAKNKSLHSEKESVNSEAQLVSEIVPNQQQQPVDTTVDKLDKTSESKNISPKKVNNKHSPKTTKKDENVATKKHPKIRNLSENRKGTESQPSRGGRGRGRGRGIRGRGGRGRGRGTGGTEGEVERGEKIGRRGRPRGRPRKQDQGNGNVAVHWDPLIPDACTDTPDSDIFANTNAKTIIRITMGGNVGESSHVQPENKTEVLDKKSRGQRKMRPIADTSHLMDEEDVIGFLSDSSDEYRPPTDIAKEIDSPSDYDEIGDKNGRKKKRKLKELTSPQPRKRGRKKSITKSETRKQKKSISGSVSEGDKNKSAAEELMMPGFSDPSENLPTSPKLSKPRRKVNKNSKCKKSKSNTVDSSHHSTEVEEEEDVDGRVFELDDINFDICISQRHGSPYTVTGTRYYIAYGFLQDLTTLLKDFEKQDSWRFKGFAVCWQKKKFSLIYRGRQNFKELLEFSEELASLTKRFLGSTHSLKCRIGALYTLYGLYYKHPFRYFFKIRMILSEFENLFGLVDKFRTDGSNPDPAYIFSRLMADGAFHHVATSDEMGLDLYSPEHELVNRIYDSERLMHASPVNAAIPHQKLESDDALLKHYHTIKAQSMGDGNEPERGMNLVRANLLEDVSSKLQTLQKETFALFQHPGRTNGNVIPPAPSTVDESDQPTVNEVSSSDIGARRANIRDRAATSIAVNKYIMNRHFGNLKKLGSPEKNMNARQHQKINNAAEVPVHNEKYKPDNSQPGPSQTEVSDKKVGILQDKNVRNFMSEIAEENFNIPLVSRSRKRRRKAKPLPNEEEMVDDPAELMDSETDDKVIPETSSAKASASNKKGNEHDFTEVPHITPPKKKKRRNRKALLISAQQKAKKSTNATKISSHNSPVIMNSSKVEDFTVQMGHPEVNEELKGISESPKKYNSSNKSSSKTKNSECRDKSSLNTLLSRAKKARKEFRDSNVINVDVTFTFKHCDFVYKKVCKLGKNTYEAMKENKEILEKMKKKMTVLLPPEYQHKEWLDNVMIEVHFQNTMQSSTESEPESPKESKYLEALSKITSNVSVTRIAPIRIKGVTHYLPLPDDTQLENKSDNETLRSKENNSHLAAQHVDLRVTVEPPVPHDTMSDIVFDRSVDEKLSQIANVSDLTLRKNRNNTDHQEMQTSLIQQPSNMVQPKMEITLSDYVEGINSHFQPVSEQQEYSQDLIVQPNQNISDAYIDVEGNENEAYSPPHTDMDNPGTPEYEYNFDDQGEDQKDHSELQEIHRQNSNLIEVPKFREIFFDQALDRSQTNTSMQPNALVDEAQSSNPLIENTNSRICQNEDGIHPSVPVTSMNNSPTFKTQHNIESSIQQLYPNMPVQGEIPQCEQTSGMLPPSIQCDIPAMKQPAFSQPSAQTSSSSSTNIGTGTNTLIVGPSQVFQDKNTGQSYIRLMVQGKPVIIPLNLVTNVVPLTSAMLPNEVVPTTSVLGQEASSIPASPLFTQTPILTQSSFMHTPDSDSASIIPRNEDSESIHGSAPCSSRIGETEVVQVTSSPTSGIVNGEREIDTSTVDRKNLETSSSTLRSVRRDWESDDGDSTLNTSESNLSIINQQLPISANEKETSTASKIVTDGQTHSPPVQPSGSRPICSFLYGSKFKALSGLNEFKGPATGTPVKVNNKPRVPFFLKQSLVRRKKP